MKTQKVSTCLNIAALHDACTTLVQKCVDNVADASQFLEENPTTQVSEAFVEFFHTIIDTVSLKMRLGIVYNNYVYTYI